MSTTPLEALSQARATFIALHRAAPIRRDLEGSLPLFCARYVERLAADIDGAAAPEDLAEALEEARAMVAAWAAVGRALPPPAPADAPPPLDPARSATLAALVDRHGIER